MEDKIIQLRHALSGDKINRVAELLDDNVNVNSIACDGMTLLIYVIQDEHSADRIENMKLLVSKGADVNLAGKKIWNEPPLHLAVAENRCDLMNTLLDAGADVNIPCETKEYTPLHLAVEIRSTKAVELLLERGADVSPVSLSLDTPLHLAAEKSNLDPKLLRCFITHNVPLNVLDWDNNSPLERALLGYPWDAELTIKVLILADSRCSENRWNDILQRKKRFHPQHVHVLERIWQMLQMNSRNPRRLRDLACFTIREYLGTSLPNVIPSLPIPESHRRQIKLMHLLDECECI